jgi:cytochrome c553
VPRTRLSHERGAGRCQDRSTRHLIDVKAANECGDEPFRSGAAVSSISSAVTRIPPPSTRSIALSLSMALCVAIALPARAQDDALPAFKTLDSIDARVQGCVTCHGRNGEGTASGYFPRIAGKPAGYLYNQLAAFRDGTRKYPPMNYLVATLPDAYLH